MVHWLRRRGRRDRRPRASPRIGAREMSEQTEGTIFIVDDNADNLSLLSAILKEGGYAVRAANSGRRALTTIEREPPELILLDINMPEMDGYEVCRRLKADESTRAIPVIFISALDDVFDK